VIAAGKTGTTNAYRDAWFDGYTGNFVGSVWFGNDDSSSMNNMTGGSLPARTWQAIMSLAHQGVELKNPYGLSGPAPALAMNRPGEDRSAPTRPSILSRRTSEAILELENLFARASLARVHAPGLAAAQHEPNAPAME
jgi:penicillin-binding protein 1A